RTHSRESGDTTRGKGDGRSIEIQRLIGRSLRGVVDFKRLGERTIYVDCDVLTADGGTRCASITGGYLGLDVARAPAPRSRAATWPSRSPARGWSGRGSWSARR